MSSQTWSSAAAQQQQPLTPSQWCQAFFIFCSATFIAMRVVPDGVRKRLMDYGARRGRIPAAEGQAGYALLEKLTTGVGQVPHRWFTHFYVVSVSWSAFWAWEFLVGGSVLGGLAERQSVFASGTGMELGQVVVAWALMALQGSRRLAECFFVTKPGSSPMLFLHWALGLAYYTTMGISVWIEGSDAILQYRLSQQLHLHLLTPKILAGTALTLFGWYKQNRFHVHLASLKKYTLPDKDWFRYIVCPHYTAECLLYVGIAVVAAPPGSLLNRTVLCGLVFVAANLGVTAYGTKLWYAGKFGAEKVAKRWIMIPFVF